MQEPPHPRLRTLAIINQRRLDTLKRRNSQGTLRNSSSKPSDHGLGARELAVGVGQQRLVLVEGYEADAGFEGVADYQRCAAGVPGAAEGGPGRWGSAVWEACVELRAGFGEFRWVGDGWWC